MKQLILYRKSDSQIIGHVSLSQDSDTQFYPSDDTQVALEIPLNHPALDNQPQWKIVNGALAQKNIVMLTASAPTFPADGTSTVSLTFAGLSGSAVVTVAGQQVTVSPADNVIKLTSDMPRTFSVQLVDTDQWSNPVNVEAV